ncbi:serine hydrolase domain-containing protein [Chitinibacter tainanensis]|uniref:serine hydrolase domain-containing protein n=1 Tax=Chitinibacter tainanensis TaxID=230667 RepID=UPI0009FD34E4|nr:serine hydrolase [Chitinibacter tainanensis]
MKKLCLCLALMSHCAVAADLPSASPESQGIDSAQLDAVLKDIQASGAAIDSVLIMRNGKVVLESYFYPYRRDVLHPQFSVTKSVTSSLAGITLAANKLSGLNQPIAPYFAALLKSEPQKGAITIGNLLDMHSGLAWYPLTSNDPESSNFQLRQSKNWQQYVLQQNMDDEPGRTFSYNNGNYVLLAGILEQAWGQSLQATAQQQLFAKLGIANSTWQKDPQGHNIGETGLALTTRDMAVLGQFWLQDGVWNQQRILPVGWIANLFSDTRAAQSAGYRRGFWVNLSEQYFQAAGSFDQFIRVEPQHQLVIVMTGKVAEQISTQSTLNQLHRIAQGGAPLAANQQAQQQLAKTIASVGQAPFVTNTRELGKSWYGKKWRFATQPLGISAVSFKPDPNDAAAIVWEVDAGWVKNEWPVGMDGRYLEKRDRNGQTLQVRGRWLNENTLEIKTQYAEEAWQWKYRFDFNADGVTASYSDNVTGEIQTAFGR